MKWETLKSGVLRSGDWFAKQYLLGWFFYRMVRTGQQGKGYETTTNYPQVEVGPVLTFEAGVILVEEIVASSPGS